MFWKHATWSWHRDDDGYMLTAEPWRNLDSGTDPHRNHTAGTAAGTAPEETRDTGDLSTPHASHVTRHAKTQLMVSVIRGDDGFGFTICCNSPVRIQSVDTGGPAHQSGLLEGDAVLQLNGLPVETWKCGDLAHAIRSCPTQIVLVVWRGSPGFRAGFCESLLHPLASSKTTKLLPQPAHSKHGRRRHQGSVVRSSLGVLGSLWRDCKEDEEHCTGVTSSGDNYIILSPVGPEEQLLHPVLDDRARTIGRLYQTLTGRGLNLLNEQQDGSSWQPLTRHAVSLATSTSATLRNYGNYQNCTIIQSHVPSYNTLHPTTLIFPVSVQPLDLCSPDRMLLLPEEMILHQADQLPQKVTVLIYSDVLLVSRKDEAGRCHVLMSPLYINTLQLQEVASTPRHIYFLQSASKGWQVVFSLEAFSLEQKLRMSLCLHDNIQQQLVAMETVDSQQFSDLTSFPGSFPDSSTDPHLLHPSPTFPPLKVTPPPAFSSPATTVLPTLTELLPPPLPSPVWKERGAGGEEEEHQQGEGESASEMSENVGGRGLLLNPAHFTLEAHKSNEEEERTHTAEDLSSASTPAVLRRSLSEGSLQQPPSGHSRSDSTIHCLTRALTFHLHTSHPSLHTLRKHLTTEDGSLHHMLLLNGSKDVEVRNHLRKKTKSLAADVRSGFPFLRRRKRWVQCGSLERALRNTSVSSSRPSAGEVLKWAESLEALLANQYGLAVFRHFLKSEFSEQNLDFWSAVERFKETHPLSKMAASAAKIYEEFISSSAPRQVNVDSKVRESTNHSLRLGVHPASFQLAQDCIFDLMEADSYPRFLKSHLYAQLANQDTGVVH
ncbi:regulator of G-protein signaling 3-like isoform X3 [Dunckerocampus dactyliophorus]|uniref:regulator of G-protein signaling 3-like isoform X3 n=1 Tax=Dunckerocampus dactyliophorus TaxID=161453 RepID=UPI002406E1F2|nr:regulator of G-protein signaling 3-like isoform X3 [Dunckerocampus dactyliophorus]